MTPTKLTSRETYVRWMVPADYASAAEIDTASFARPWGDTHFRTVLRARPVIGKVIEVPPFVGPWGERHGKVGGFMVYLLDPVELVLLRLAVAPEYRGRGVGRALVEHLVAKLKTHHRTAATVDVPADHLPVQKFMRACGWRCTGSEPGDDREGGCGEVYRFEYRIGEPLPVELGGEAG